MSARHRQFIVATHELVVDDPFDRSDTPSRGWPDWNITATKPVRDLRILDVGCGTGVDVWYLADSNTVVGLDLSPRSLSWASQREIQSVIADAECPLPFGDALFDIVVVKDVFEHLLNPTKLLLEVSRVLKEGGTLVANVPNHFYLSMRLQLLLGRGLIMNTVFGDQRQYYDDWNYQHVRFFTWDGFRRFLGQVHFSHIDYVWDLGQLLYHPKDRILARMDSEDFTRRSWRPILKPLVHLFFAIFPRPIRVTLARWRPGLFCGSFYARCTKPGSLADAERRDRRVD